MNISAVIPTRNRAASLKRVLQCLASQTKPPNEIIIVDSSDDKAPLRAIVEEFKHLPVVLIDSVASVCIQRNIGIGRAAGDWIFLCDDDMEFDAAYLDLLSTFAVKQQGGAVSGLWMQLENGNWISQYPIKKFRVLLWRYLFQQSIWGDLTNVEVPPFLKRLYDLILRFYEKRGNTTTLAGWPLITNQSGAEFFTTKIYSLGASLVKREWLLNAPYDEVLDPSGIGDNYGVEVNFPRGTAVQVLRTALVYHHRASENRLNQALSYYRRVLALHYFIKKINHHVTRTTGWFIWSLFGNLLIFLRRGEMAKARATGKAILLILFGRNPYWVAHKTGSKIIKPV